MSYKHIPDYVDRNLGVLRVSRISKGLSVHDLRLYTGVNMTTLYNYENGNTPPARPTYNRLAKFFGWKLWNPPTVPLI